MKKVFISIIMLSVSVCAFAQTMYQAQDILNQISDGEVVSIDNAIIVGDLDFTSVKKKAKGGRYGVRGGIAQEYFTLVVAPMTFTSCTFLGEIITKSEVKVNRERQENFTNIQADMTFINCTFDQAVRFESMRAKHALTIEECVFQQVLKFEHVTFSQTPELTGNTFNGKFINKNTNWKADRKQIEKNNPQKKANVHLTLHNPTMKTIRIAFGSHKWKLSPYGKSGISSPAGTKIYIVDKQSKRVALVLNKEQAGSVIDISKL